jgi:hypothetical protein
MATIKNITLFGTFLKTVAVKLALHWLETCHYFIKNRLETNLLQAFQLKLPTQNATLQPLPHEK